jgi:hypothetical protein
MENKMQLLIEILLDKNAREDERDDAAIDLRLYKDIHALEALMKIASDPTEDIILIDGCAESIGEICVGLNFFDEESFSKLHPLAQDRVFYYINHQKPTLINEKSRSEITKRSQRQKMKIKKIDIPAAGTWARDCELLYLSDCKGFKLCYHKDEDDTYWSLQCRGIIAYKVFSEEFSRAGYLVKLPTEGAFFEILDFTWKHEFGQEQASILDECKHYVLQFYDETVEMIAREFIFEQLKERPILS